jgi:Flp pilus assembly protein protease CpaA
VVEWSKIGLKGWADISVPRIGNFQMKNKEYTNMNRRNIWNWIAFALFILGMVFSVIGGIWYKDSSWIAMLLAIAGLVIGIIYAVAAKDIKTLLLSSIALLLMTAAFSPITVWDIGDKIQFILVDFGALVAPIALISAVKGLILLGLEKVK